jgi:FkbM family methyltransferase
MGMAKLAGHDAFVCVDTRSWESLIYIQGHPVEPNEVSVMTRFVGPGDTFVDIGANFGLYSMIAAERIGSEGKLYAFEPNPHTFEYLRHSALANRLFWLPNYTFENQAVSDRGGSLEFAFDPGNLGSAHVRNTDDAAGPMTIVEVNGVRLDDYFSEGEQLDFVKIDVEGHELHVLKGMTQTILRSPNIRLLIEYYTFTSEITEFGRGVVDYVRSLGLGLCRVIGDGRLEVIPEGQIPTGNEYLLATRTPEADAATQAQGLRIAPKGLTLHAVYREGEHALMSAAGTLEYDADKSGSVAEPTLFFGPYIDLSAGRYQLSIDAQGVGRAHLSLIANGAIMDIAVFDVDSWPATVEFTLEEDVRQFEVVLRKTNSLERLSLRHLTLDRI